MFPIRRWCLAFPAVAMIVVGSASLAWAEAAPDDGPDQDDPVEHARVLFREGIDLSDNEQYAEAADRFRRALDLHDAPSIRLNLAFNLVELGQHQEAAGHLDTMAAMAETTQDLTERAQSLWIRIREHLGRLSIQANLAPGQIVRLDGDSVQEQSLGTPVWVVAGVHDVSIEDAGEVLAQEEVHVTAGETISVVLRIMPTPSETAQAHLDAQEGQDGEGGQPEPPRPLARDWRLWVAVGGGVALVTGLVLGLVFGLRDRTEDPVVGTMEPGVLVWR